MLAIEPYQNHEVRAVHYRHVARFHGDPVRVFDARGQAVNLDQVAADSAREVRQVGQCRDNADLGGVGGHCSHTQHPDERDDQEKRNNFDLIVDSSSPALAFLPAVRV